MKDKPIRFNEEGLRQLTNSRQAYEAWLGAAGQFVELRDRLVWKTVSARDYLYRVRDRYGNGSSLGPRSAETESFHLDYTRRRESARARLDALVATLAEQGRLWRAARLPVIASPGAHILREADVRGLLGSALIVVGTNAIAAYEAEALERVPPALEATNDFDLTWALEPSTTLAVTAEPLREPILGMLKAVDETYTVNMEREFQALNSKAFAVELLLPQSLAGGYPKNESLRPIAMREQDWLLNGTRVDQIVCGRDGTVARMVAPDPRWYALLKLWLADQPQRSRSKVEKDRAQGETLLDMIQRSMPHYPLDDKFRREMADELRRYLPS